MDSFRITALIAAAALLPAARASAASVAALASPDACTVLTSAQVSAVLGVRVEAGQHLVPGAHSSCGWAAPGDPSLGAKRLVLTLMSARAFETGKTPIRSATKVVAQAVGDEAYYITTPPFGTALSVKQGGSYFQVRISGFPDAQSAHLEKAVALKLLAPA
jgi:hypothetical protein